MCAAVCYPLASLLGQYGVAVRVMESDLSHTNHVWLQLADGRVLDPTADQFNTAAGPSLPAVYLGPPLIYHTTLSPRAEGRETEKPGTGRRFRSQCVW